MIVDPFEAELFGGEFHGETRSVLFEPPVGGFFCAAKSGEEFRDGRLYTIVGSSGFYAGTHREVFPEFDF
jgi:hypothetical protein